ncbi:hypothetical protein ACOME3_008019 [Neoechinorhynchus agilis]
MHPEYAVALFVYMTSIIKYPRDRISILTTYNGQKHLIRDVISVRCRGKGPKIVSTVDKYQGQQNDYIILSLVRSKSSVGHLRDVRRLVVAMSRARLGLYILGKVDLFSRCLELKSALKTLMVKPVQLCLLPHERFEVTKRRPGGCASFQSVLTVTDVSHMMTIVKDLSSQDKEIDKSDKYNPEEVSGSIFLRNLSDMEEIVRDIIKNLVDTVSH